MMSCTSLPRLGLICSVLPRQQRREVAGLKPLRLLRRCHTTVIGVILLLWRGWRTRFGETGILFQQPAGKGPSLPSVKRVAYVHKLCGRPFRSSTG